MTQNEIDRAEWEDPRNWRGGWLGIYHSTRDSRTLVPKRHPLMGATINTARPVGKIVLGILLVLPLLGLMLAYMAER